MLFIVASENELVNSDHALQPVATRLRWHSWSLRAARVAVVQRTFKVQISHINPMTQTLGEMLSGSLQTENNPTRLPQATATHDPVSDGRASVHRSTARVSQGPPRGGSVA